MVKLKRKFIVGQEWLYYKIYSGPNTSDSILINIIHPVVEKLLKKGLIDQWFFIRYSDPQHHLRVRFHLTKNENLSYVVLSILPYLENYLNQGLVWKIQTDTYERELERYGFDKITLSEELFFHESEMITMFLRVHDEHSLSEDIRWIFGLMAIDDLLNNLNFSSIQKMELLQILKTNFAKEFNLTRALKKQLDQKYRNESSKIFKFIVGFNDLESELWFMKELIEKRKRQSNEICKILFELNNINLLGLNYDSLIGSYIHMLCNRLFLVNARMHEMVLYDFLFRHYKSVNARKGSKLI